MALAIALNRKHYPIESLVAAHLRSAKKAAGLLDASTVPLAVKDIPQREPTAVVIIATPDDQIDSVVKQLEKLPPKPNRFAIHTSGAISSSILAPLKSKNWHTGSLHPLISVSDPVAGSEALPGAYWCVEGDLLASRLAREIVQDLDGHSFSIKAEDKSLYHAAAVMSSGNMVALFDVALEMLEHCGLPRKEARKIFLPLIQSTVANLARVDPSIALTGTFARADEATVARHLVALSVNDFSETRNLYRQLGRRSVELAMSRGVNEQALKKILKRLKA